MVLIPIKFITKYKIVQDRWYEGKINIINRSEGREIYDVTKIKSIKANEVLNGEEFLAAQLDTFYTTSVSQKEENATDFLISLFSLLSSETFLDTICQKKFLC